MTRIHSVGQPLWTSNTTRTNLARHALCVSGSRGRPDRKAPAGLTAPMLRVCCATPRQTADLAGTRRVQRDLNCRESCWTSIITATDDERGPGFDSRGLGGSARCETARSILIATEPEDGDGGTCRAYASCTSASECAPDETCTSGCCTPIVK